MVGWAILLHRFPGDASVTSLGRGVELAYGVLDVFIFAVVLRLIVSAGNRSASLWLLLMGPAFFVVSDGLRHWSTHLDDYTPGSWTDGGWLLFPLLLGAASLY